VKLLEEKKDEQEKIGENHDTLEMFIKNDINNSPNVYYMYNSKFICTYNYYDPSLSIPHGVDMSKIDKEDIEGLEDMSEILYQAELLQVFEMVEYKNEIVHDALDMICEKIGNYEPFKKVVEKITDFPLLFSYDYFYLTHACISEFLEKGEMSSEKIDLLYFLL